MAINYYNSREVLRATYTTELAEDLRVQAGMDVEEELARIFQEEMAREVEASRLQAIRIIEEQQNMENDEPVVYTQAGFKKFLNS